jgi:hypothetical protein
LRSVIIEFGSNSRAQSAVWRRSAASRAAGSPIVRASTSLVP